MKMALNSKDVKSLATDLRNFKGDLEAIGLSKEITSKLDGFASQVESFASQDEQASTEEQDAERPSGKLGPERGPEPAVKTGNVDAQTQLDNQKGSKDPNVPNVSTISEDHSRTAETVTKNGDTAAKKAEEAKK